MTYESAPQTHVVVESVFLVLFLFFSCIDLFIYGTFFEFNGIQVV